MEKFVESLDMESGTMSQYNNDPTHTAKFVKNCWEIIK